jgi:cation diffusion facilitator CzcD-associated flavoprotein CzcO
MAATARATPEIAIVGAGFGGLGLAIALTRAGIRTFTVFERAAEIGGTWRDNTYPGAACDVPSHLYSFSNEPKADWARAYATQPEILAYLMELTEKYALRERIRFNAGVARAVFDEHAELWRLELAGGEIHEASVLVAACGQLHRPAIPEIPGRDAFAGPQFHSARWRHDVELDGKRVAVIGTGASAVQFVPEIAPLAARLTVFQRTPPYVLHKPDRAYGERQRTRFRRFPWLQRLVRTRAYLAHETAVLGFSYFRPVLALPRRAFRHHLEKAVAAPGLRAKLTPEYAIGCKRVMISNDYLPALARQNVEVVNGPIERVTPTGVVAGGREYPADVLIYATGFTATDFLVPMIVTGRSGRDLHVAWRNGAEAYLGITVSGFPNFFLLYGPNTNLGHNSVVYMIESQIRYVMGAIDALRKGARSLDVLPAVQSRYNESLQRRLARTVWESGCSSWYKTAAGKNTNNWPGFTFEYRRRTRTFDLEDYMPWPSVPASSSAAPRTESDARPPSVSQTADMRWASTTLT